jgi:alkylation response protein AidB-like acyl-CoA dehydrogenase
MELQLDEYRKGLDAFLDEHHDELRPSFEGAGTIDEQMAQLSKVRRLCYDAEWSRWGWPEAVGGLGGSSLLRAYLNEALVARDLVEPGYYSMPEVLAPAVISYASADLMGEMVPKLLRGDETWCQGFSEPGAGSDLASLSCRAVRDGDNWVVNGQKVWTSLAQFAERCVLLVRTGTPESRHRGITALFVDMDSPGLTIRPIETMHGTPEFSEVFYDDVLVPVDRTIGDEGQGWGLAMDLLPYERSTSLWQRAAFLHRTLQEIIEQAEPANLDARSLGEVTQLLYAFRTRSRATQHKMARGEALGPETSIDKVLLATAEQAVLDLAEEALATQVTIGDDPTSVRWRTEFLYSRASTIYGGSAEIQRNIISKQLLDLGNDR